MSDLLIKVDKTKHRDALRVPSRTDTDTVSRGSTHRDSSRSPSTSATSLTSGGTASTDSIQPGVPKQAPRPTRVNEHIGRSPLTQFERQTASMRDLLDDDPLLSDNRTNVSQNKGFIQGPYSRDREARNAAREALKDRADRPTKASTTHKQSSATAQPSNDYSVMSKYNNKRQTDAYSDYYKWMDEIRPIEEPGPPAASQHTYQPRKPEDRPECQQDPVPEVIRRRTSMQMVKDKVGSFHTMTRSVTAKVNKGISRRLTNNVEPQDIQVTDIQLLQKADADADRPRATSHHLPDAAEVYNKPTYFKDCPHMSPPAHLPLNAMPRNVDLTRGLLRCPTQEHQLALKALEQNPGMKPHRVQVVNGLCAKCDLTARREQETSVLMAWNHKHDKFARRLNARRIALEREFNSGFAENALRRAGRESPIHALEDKLLEVIEQREIAVAAIWLGFKARWGVQPAGIIAQKQKERPEYGRTTPPNWPPREDQHARDRAGASRTGFMHNGVFGMPMDHVNEPGRMRLSWSRANVDVPKVPADFRQGQGLAWTRDEYKLLELEPWEK